MFTTLIEHHHMEDPVGGTQIGETDHEPLTIKLTEKLSPMGVRRLIKHQVVFQESSSMLQHPAKSYTIHTLMNHERTPTDWNKQGESFLKI